MSANIANENILFAWRVSVIEAHSRQIASATHLFDGLTTYDTSLEKLNLRQSARALRESAARLEHIADQLASPPTAFPDFNAMEAAQGKQ